MTELLNSLINGGIAKLNESDIKILESTVCGLSIDRNTFLATVCTINNHEKGAVSANRLTWFLMTFISLSTHNPLNLLFDCILKDDKAVRLAGRKKNAPVSAPPPLSSPPKVTAAGGHHAGHPGSYNFNLQVLVRPSNGLRMEGGDSRLTTRAALYRFVPLCTALRRFASLCAVLGLCGPPPRRYRP